MTAINTTPERVGFEAAVRDAEAAITNIDRETSTTNGEIRKWEREASTSAEGEALVTKIAAAKLRVVGLERQRKAAETTLQRAKDMLDYHRHDEAVLRDDVANHESIVRRAAREADEAEELSRRLRATVTRETAAAEAKKAALVQMVGSSEPPAETEAQRFARLVKRQEEMRR